MFDSLRQLHDKWEEQVVERTGEEGGGGGQREGQANENLTKSHLRESDWIAENTMVTYGAHRMCVIYTFTHVHKN